MKALLLPTLLCLTVQTLAQQIGNAGFENWDNLGSNQEEPLIGLPLKPLQVALLHLLPSK